MFPRLNNWHKEYRDQGLEVIGITTYYENLAFDKETGKLKTVGQTVENDKTGKVEVVGGLQPAEELDMLRAFAAYNKLRYRIVTLSKENYVKSATDYARRSIPQSVLIDRLGIIRLVTSGATEEGSDNLEAQIKKLLGERWAGGALSVYFPTFALPAHQVSSPGAHIRGHFADAAQNAQAHEAGHDWKQPAGFGAAVSTGNNCLLIPRPSVLAQRGLIRKKEHQK
jgi:hypothetical protein